MSIRRRITRELRRIIAVAELTRAISDSVERDVVRKRHPATSIFTQMGKYGREHLFSMDIPPKLENLYPEPEKFKKIQN